MTEFVYDDTIYIPYYTLHKNFLSDLHTLYEEKVSKG